MGLVKMALRVVHARYSLPEWQAVKLTFLHPEQNMKSKGLNCKSHQKNTTLAHDDFLVKKVTPRVKLRVHITTLSAKYLKSG